MMLLTLLWLAGCTDAIPEPPPPPAPSEAFPYGLDPDECVPGSVVLGASWGDYLMTQDELQPYRCLDVLQVRNVDDLELPNLEVVSSFILAMWAPDRSPVDVSLPSLQAVGGLAFIGPVRSVDVGQLRSVGYLGVGTAESGDLTDFAGVESIQLIYLYNGTDFSGLQISTTDLHISNTEVSTLAGLGNLTEVGLVFSLVDMDNVLGLDNVVRLRTLDIRQSSIDTLDGLGSVLTAGSISVTEVSDLPSFSPMSTLQSIDGEILIDDADGLVSVGLPALTQVGGDLRVQSTAATTIDLPLLEEVGGDVVFRDNPNLPACEVERLVARLQANGFTGAVENSGNDTEAVCSAP